MRDLAVDIVMMFRIRKPAANPHMGF